MVYYGYELRWSSSDNTLKEPDASGSFYFVYLLLAGEEIRKARNAVYCSFLAFSIDRNRFTYETPVPISSSHILSQTPLPVRRSLLLCRNTAPSKNGSGRSSRRGFCRCLLNFWKLLVIFLERTIIAIPLIVLFANIIGL